MNIITQEYYDQEAKVTEVLKWLNEHIKCECHECKGFVWHFKYNEWKEAVKQLNKIISQLPTINCKL